MASQVKLSSFRLAYSLFIDTYFMNGNSNYRNGLISFENTMFDSLGINYNLIYFIDKKTMSIIPLMANLTYDFNCIQFVAGDIITAAVYINCNMVIVSYCTVHPKAIQLINIYNYQYFVFWIVQKHSEVVTIRMQITASCQTTSPQKMKNLRTKIQKHGMQSPMDKQKRWTQNTQRQDCFIRKSIKRDPDSYKYCVCCHKIKAKRFVKNDDCIFISGAFTYTAQNLLRMMYNHRSKIQLVIVIQKFLIYKCCISLGYCFSTKAVICMML